MSVVVFGGGGFIGSHVTERLLTRGENVTVVDVDTGKIDHLRDDDLLTVHELDIRNEGNESTCRGLVEEADVAFDLIAYANPQQYVDRPIDVVELNLFENLKIVDYCIEANTRLIQFSTCEVYGKMGNRSDVEFREGESDLILGPIENQRWIYSNAKQLLERLVYAYGDEGDLRYTIVRPFNFIGPKMDYIIESPDEGTPRVFASFMSSLLYDHPMFLVDGGTNQRSFTAIEDAVDAIELLYENPDGEFDNEIVNIGTPENEATIAELARTMRDIYQDRSPNGTLPDLVEVPGEEFYGEGYEDCERRVPSIEKLTSMGWSPEYGLRETLERAMEYYIREHEGAQTPLNGDD